MAFHKHLITIFNVLLFTSFFLSLFAPNSYSSIIIVSAATDADYIGVALNLEYLEAEFFLFGSLGYGLDIVSPDLAQRGPSPIGGRLATLDPLTKDVILQFGLQEVGHLRAIKSTVQGFPRPLLNISSQVFAAIMNDAFGRPLRPPFDPYANSINYLLASYVIPYVGLTGYVGTIPMLQNTTTRQLVAGLLGVESGQDAVIRTLLYERRHQLVRPYAITVADFTNCISNLRDRVGNAGLKDEGLVVPRDQGSEGKVSGNVLSANNYSLSYGRTPPEILKIVYGTGNESVPGGFYPRGADGRIAKSYLLP